MSRSPEHLIRLAASGSVPLKKFVQTNMKNITHYLKTNIHKSHQDKPIPGIVSMGFSPAVKGDSDSSLLTVFEKSTKKIHKFKPYVSISSGLIKNYNMPGGSLIFSTMMQKIIREVIDADFCPTQAAWDPDWMRSGGIGPKHGPKEKADIHKTKVIGIEFNPGCAEKHLYRNVVTLHKRELFGVASTSFPDPRSPDTLFSHYRLTPEEDGYVPICACKSCSVLLSERNVKFQDKPRTQSDLYVQSKDWTDDFKILDSGIIVPNSGIIHESKDVSGIGNQINDDFGSDI